MVAVFPRAMNTQKSASAKLQRLDGSPVRVLVVDDENNLTELLSMALRYEGWEIRTAATGVAAGHSFRSMNAAVASVRRPNTSAGESVYPSSF